MKQKMIDLRNETPKSDGQYRCIQVYQCRVCGWMTNELSLDWAGIPGHTCPNLREKWHREIERKYKHSLLPHPASYQRELLAEIEAARKRVKGEIVHDLVGDYDLAQKIDGLIEHSFLGPGEFLTKD